MVLKVDKIITNRLVIRSYTKMDARLFKEAIDSSLKELTPWMPWAKYDPESIENKEILLETFDKQFKKGEDYNFGIFDINEEYLIGSTGLHPRIDGNAMEIGYWLNTLHYNKGYAVEAVKSLLFVGFKFLKLERIEIHCDILNVKSRKIPVKLDFLVFSQTNREIQYVIYRKDWENSTHANLEIKVTTLE